MRRALAALAALLVASASWGAVLFEDNFDSHPDWSPLQSITQDQSSSDGSATVACTGCPQGTAKYAAYYQAMSAWSDYRGHNTLNIDATNARGGSGKALTFWMEPIDSSRCDGGTYWCSDGQLAVRLATPQNELYIGRWIKFDPTWVWDSVYETSAKFLHMSHYDPNAGYSFWDWHGPATGNRPYNVMNLVYPVGVGGGNRMVLRWTPRYQATWLPAQATPALTQGSSLYDSIGSGYLDYCTGLGTGFGGCQTWAELFGDGQWHHEEFHFKYNTTGGYYGGTANGEFHYYVDGTLRVSRTDLAWADGADTQQSYTPTAPLGWNNITIGGNQYNRKYPASDHTEQWYAVDDVVVSTTYIGPAYVIGTAGSPAARLSGALQGTLH